MSDNRSPKPILINKYPNRRYYDTLNSQHVTLQDVHDLIISGKDVCITDSQTGEDLTNVVLMQILVEKDHVKLDLIPSSVMHMMIRSSRNTLRTTLERYFSPFLGMMAAGQKQFDSYLRETMKGQLVSPMEWTNGVLRAFGDNEPPNSPTSPRGKNAPTPEVDDADAAESELDSLRTQLESLQKRMTQLGAGTKKPRKSGTKKAVRKQKTRR